jgi:Glycosyl transferase family 2
MASTPSLSVVVVLLEGPAKLERCLVALGRQNGVTGVEVIVPWEARWGDSRDMAARFPAVKFLRVAGSGTYAELRAAGIREARGAIVAITEDHCVPQPDWCAEIVSAHKSVPCAAIGGAVEKLSPDTALDWAFYLADYLRYMNPVTDGPAHELTDCNVSYKRAALETIRDVWSTEFHEPAVHGALDARGDGLWLSARIVVQQQRSLSWKAAIRDRYAFGRLFGSTRVSRQPASRRMLYAASSFLLPALLLVRAAGHIRRKGRCRGEFLRALPAMAVICTVWAWGEFAGYVTGTPEASLLPGLRTAGAKS